MKGTYNLPSFYYCPTCGKIVQIINHSDKPLMCCEQEMDKLPLDMSEEDMNKLLPACSCSKHKPRWWLCLIVPVLVIGCIVIAIRLLSKKEA